MIVIEGEKGKRVTYVRDLQSALSDCYEGFKLPTEMHFKWARPGEVQIIEAEEWE